MHMCDMIHSYVWHDSFICVTWTIHMCGMTRSWVRHTSEQDSNTMQHTYMELQHAAIHCNTLQHSEYVTHLQRTCHTYERHVTLFKCVTHMNESCHTYEWVMSHVRTIHVAQMNESCHTVERVMSLIWTSHVTHLNDLWHTSEYVR